MNEPKVKCYFPITKEKADELVDDILHTINRNREYIIKTLLRSNTLNCKITIDINPSEVVCMNIQSDNLVVGKE